MTNRTKARAVEPWAGKEPGTADTRDWLRWFIGKGGEMPDREFERLWRITPRPTIQSRNTRADG